MTPPEPSSRTLTFLFTDIEGSTGLWQEHPDAMREAVADHDAVSRRELAAHGGQVFGVGGDGFFAAFESTASALSAARALQAEFSDEGLINLRIGLHTGEANERDDAFFGVEVNRTARVTTCGHGGQILVSGVTAELTPDDDLVEIGTFELRGIAGLTAIWQLGAGDFPPLRAVEETLGNVVAPRDRFVGREAEVHSVVSALTDHQIVTVIGTGGVGKTRLVTECAPLLASEYQDGVWFISLAPLTEPNLVASVIVNELNLPVAPGGSDLDVLIRWVHDKDALLVLDNCEHLMESVSSLVDRIVDRHASADVLATSQAPLRLKGEKVIAVGPLGGDSTSNASVELFIERAEAVQDGIEFTDADRAAIGEICEQLDHIPLAVELAASRVRMLSPAEIAAMLTERFRLLASRDRTSSDRHRTLENAVRWSYDLLTESQQLLLRRLAVFPGPFDIDQAKAVAADNDLDEWEVLDGLADLVERSLAVARAVDDGGSTRYQLLESIKAFGRERLDEFGERYHCEERFLAEFHRLTVSAGADLLREGDKEAVDLLLVEWLNVRGALQLAVQDDASARFEEMYAALGPMWNPHCRTTEGAQWAESLLVRDQIDPAARAAALNPAACAANSASSGSGRRYVDLARRLWTEHGTEPPVAAMANSALDSMLNGEDDRARSIIDEVFSLCGELDNDTWNRNQAAITSLGVLATIDEDLSVFLEAYEHERARAERLGSPWHKQAVHASTCRLADRMGIEDPAADVLRTAEGQMDMRLHHAASHSYEALAILELKAGNLRAAAAAHLKALDLALLYGPGFVNVRLSIAVAILMTDHPRDATRLLGFLRTYRERHGVAGITRLLNGELFFEAVLQESCGDDFEALLEDGRIMPDDDALAMARDRLDHLAEPTVVDDGRLVAPRDPTAWNPPEDS